MSYVIIKKAKREGGVKMRFYTIATLIIILLGTKDVIGQTSTQYYFLGYIYSRAEGQELSESKVYPYLPVVLKMAEEPDKVLAVKVANGNGEVSFKGVPIDIYKDYHFEILGLGTSDLKYQMKGTKEPYKFASGNLTTHIRLPENMSSNFTIEELMIDKSEEDMLLTELLQKHAELSYEEGSFFSEEGDLPYKLLINGRADFNEKRFIPMLPQLSGGLVKSVKIIRYSDSNPYYEGAIDLHLIQGEITDSSTAKRELLSYTIQQVK